MSQPMTSFAMGRLGIPMPAMFLGVTQVVNVGSSSVQVTNSFNSGLVRVAVTTACYIAYGTNPTATTSSAFMPSGSVEYFAVEPGTKFAFIRLTSDGAATCTEADSLAD